jgi:hypothetical protein
VRPRRAGIWKHRATYVFLALAGSWAHAFLALPLYSALDRFLACVLLWIALLVIQRFIAAARPEPPTMTLVSSQFYVMYGLPQFTQESILLIHGPFTPSGGAITLAMLLATFASASLWISYEVTRRSLSSRRGGLLDRMFPKPQMSWRRPTIFYAVLCTGVLLWQLGAPDAIPLVLRNFVAKVFSPSLALVLLLLLGYRFRDSSCRNAALVMIGVLCVTGAIWGTLLAIVIPIYLFFMAKWLWAGQLHVRWVTIGVFVFLLLNPVKAQYRGATREAEPVRSLSQVMSRLDLWREALYDTYADPFGARRSIETSASRTSGLLDFGHVIDWTPDRVPYQYGKGFSTALLFWVPRVVWPDKPSVSDLVNNRYAIEFQITSVEGITSSTFGMRQPADGYWDFGFAGAILYPVVFGIIIAMLSPRRKDSAFLLISLLFSAEFFQTLDNLQYIVASVLTLLVGSFIAMKAIESAAGSYAERDRRGTAGSVVQRGQH